ncbi:hypothetical protein pipiens_016342 [Culex pipiens pipiens]|uniref:Uncharacterized protein n=1 Tax=Culex pipiens pipiens TaxID=38569 RepID=A0ABD1CMM9_CULPP
METFTDYEICELQEIELYPIRPLHMVLPKGSPLKEPFRVSIRLMMDTGLLHDYEQCELQEIETYPTRPLQIVIPKGSPLKEPFRVSIRLMMDTGLVQYYRRKFFMKRPPCSTDSFATVKVGFWDIASLYWLLVAGFAISSLVLAVEILEFRVRMHFLG